MSRKQGVPALLPARPARTCPSGRCEGAGVHAVCAGQRRHNRHGLWDGQGPSRAVLIKSAEGVPGNIAPSPAMRRTGKQTFPEGRGSCPVRQNRQGRHQGEQGKKGLHRTQHLDRVWKTARRRAAIQGQGAAVHRKNVFRLLYLQQIS